MRLTDGTCCDCGAPLPMHFGPGRPRKRCAGGCSVPALDRDGAAAVVTSTVDRPARTGRCAEDDCDTILSRYNPSPWCSVHERRHLRPHFGWTG